MNFFVNVGIKRERGQVLQVVNAFKLQRLVRRRHYCSDIEIRPDAEDKPWVGKQRGEVERMQGLEKNSDIGLEHCQVSKVGSFLKQGKWGVAESHPGESDHPIEVFCHHVEKLGNLGFGIIREVEEYLIAVFVQDPEIGFAVWLQENFSHRFRGQLCQNSPHLGMVFV